MGGTGKDRTLRRLGAQASLPREFPTPEVSRDPVWQPDPAWPFLAQTSEQVPAPTSKGSRLTSAFSQLADQSASSLTAVPVWECGMKECGELRVSLESASRCRHQQTLLPHGLGVPSLRSRIPQRRGQKTVPLPFPG